MIRFCGCCQLALEATARFAFVATTRLALVAAKRVRCAPQRKGYEPNEGEMDTGPGPPRGGYVPLAFHTVNRSCTALFHGRAGRSTAENGGFRPRAVVAIHNAVNERTWAEILKWEAAHKASRGRYIHFHAPCLYCLENHD